MLPLSPETLVCTADNLSSIQRHEPHHHHPIESSSCSRPQMAWQMYQQLLRIANRNQQKQSTPKDEKIDTKRLWLAAFTGPSLSYRPGVAAGVAEPL